MKSHPTRALIKSDATDIHGFRGFIVHTMVQIAAHKQETNLHSKDNIIHHLSTQKHTD